MTEQLIIKDVDFQGTTLKSAQDKTTNKIYVGVKWVCNGIGLSRGQSNGEINKIQSDIVLQQGCTKFHAGVFDTNNETIALDIDFLPLWLAKISITPKMKDNSPEVVNKLINYQLKAKDVLAKAFIYGEFDLPKDYKSALSQLVLMCEEKEILQNEKQILEKINTQLQDNNTQLQPKAQLCDAFLNSKGYVSLNKVAKSINKGRNKMMKFLRQQQVLFKDGCDNIAYQRFCNNGYFKVDYTIGRDGKIHATTRVSPKGVDYIHKLYQQNEVQ